MASGIIGNRSAGTCFTRRQWLVTAGVCHASSFVQAARNKPLELLARVDDLGATRSLNRGVKQSVTEGIARNVSVLAPSPFIAEAAPLARNPHICFGLHTCLNSEWTGLRWGPVAPRDEVPTLTGQDGTLHQYPDDLKVVAWRQALTEFNAQLQRVRKLGFDIRYADSHMGAIDRVPGLAERFGAWCRQNELIDYRSVKTSALPTLPNYWQRPEHRMDPDYPELFLAALKSAERSGYYLVVGHPAFADPETRRLGHRGYPGDAVAWNLNLERLAFVSPNVIKYVKTGAVRLVTYADAARGASR